MENVEVDDDVVVHRNFRNHREERLGDAGEVGILGMGGEDVNLPSLILVFSSGIALSVQLKRLKVRQLSYPVVPPCHGLQDQFAHGSVGGRQPSGKQTSQRLRTFDQRANSFLTVLCV